MQSNHKQKSLFKRFQRPRKTDQSRTYIIPTAFGFAFAAVCFLLLLMAVGFSNNIIYFFVFYLISIALVAMLMTNSNVDRVQILSIQPENIFAGENNKVLVHLKNTKIPASYSLQLYLDKKNHIAEVPLLNGLETATTICFWKPIKRGLHPLPRLQMQTRFPFGMLHSWCLYRKDQEILVYPQKEGFEVLPKDQGGAGFQSTAGLFKEHRIFQSSDSTKRIDWRVSQKFDQLMVKTFESQSNQSIHLDYKFTLPLADFEKRVSQLALWTDLAEKNKMNYSFAFNDFSLPVDSGDEHYHKIMAYLATVEFR